MSFDFKENLTLYMPQVESQVKTISEAAATKTNKLVIELAAIHEGITSNFNHYRAGALEASLATWVSPYPKPIILNHDVESESVGRVMAAKMAKEDDGTPYIRLQVGITSPEAIDKCIDERFLTGSVGGKADSATCSICSTDWAKASGHSAPCKHVRGKVYNGKIATLELDGLNWKEYSFVNIPADTKSSFRSITTGTNSAGTETEEGWVRAVSFYSIDMDKESIVQLNESESPHDVLAPMKKKEAHATYLNVLGTFLSVTAHDYIENSEEKRLNVESNTTIKNEQEETMPTQESTEENDMSQATEENATEEDDILAVSTGLSADLASTEAETVSKETVVEETSTEEVVTTEASAEEEVTTEEVVTETAAEETATEDTELADKEEAAVELPVESETATQEVAPEIEALKNELDTLKTENAKLKKHMHYMLAERVVDAKIAVGLTESSERAEMLEEHSKRSASSLADALRDLSGYSSKVKIKDVSEGIVQVEDRSITTEGSDDKSIIFVPAVAKIEESEPPVKKLENILVDALMNRKKLS